MRSFARIFWLGTKELRTLLGSIALMGFLVYSFTFSVYQQSEGVPEDVNRASVAFVDEDQPCDLLDEVPSSRRNTTTSSVLICVPRWFNRRN